MYISEADNPVLAGLVPAQGYWVKGAIPPLDGEGRREAAGWGDFRLQFSSFTPHPSRYALRPPRKGEGWEAPRSMVLLFIPIPMKTGHDG
jgi:hypothetical protein